MTDNVAILEGYTREVHGTAPEMECNFLVKPDQDLSQQFRAWNMHDQEWVIVFGWVWEWDEGNLGG